ncbi:hypothetical protein R3P38DRAFT_2779469 [Favolaschia claudopus]|uniref:Uncharacterized protein n=1 Tax=Favolaschia claudopus TaxID=2862362 RepID=A0AAW0BFZ8_9AGAR
MRSTPELRDRYKTEFATELAAGALRNGRGLETKDGNGAIRAFEAYETVVGVKTELTESIYNSTQPPKDEASTLKRERTCSKERERSYRLESRRTTCPVFGVGRALANLSRQAVCGSQTYARQGIDEHAAGVDAKARPRRLFKTEDRRFETESSTMTRGAALTHRVSTFVVNGNGVRGRDAPQRSLQTENKRRNGQAGSKPEARVVAPKFAGAAQSLAERGEDDETNAPRITLGSKPGLNVAGGRTATGVGWCAKRRPSSRRLAQFNS